MFSIKYFLSVTSVDRASKDFEVNFYSKNNFYAQSFLNSHLIFISKVDLRHVFGRYSSFGNKSFHQKLHIGYDFWMYSASKYHAFIMQNRCSFNIILRALCMRELRFSGGMLCGGMFYLPSRKVNNSTTPCTTWQIGKKAKMFILTSTAKKKN